MIGTRAALATVALALALLGGPVRAEDALETRATVVTPDQPAARSITAWHIEGVDYLGLGDVAYLFRATKYWRAELEKMVLKVGDHRVRLTVGSSFVFVDDEGTNLRAPVRWHGGEILVPVSLATDVLDGLVTEAVTWDRDRRALRVDTGDPNVLSVDYDVRRNGTVVEIVLGAPLSATLETPVPRRAVVHVPGGVLDDGLRGAHPAMGLLDSLVATQESGFATLTFVLGAMGGTPELLARGSPPRLLLAVSEETADDIPLPEFDRGEVSAPREVRVVVIDPGHGGSEPGVVSADGLAEKDVTLAIAMRLRDRLVEADGLEVHLTRTGDRFLSATDRAERANALAPDVFLSLHCNGWFDPGLRGFSVGVPRAGVPETDTGLLRWGSRTLRSRRDTEALAEILLEQLGTRLAMPNRGVRTAAYAEVEGTFSPAVHVECGFLSNPEDASLLADPEFQTSVAQALARGVREYRGFLASGEVGSP